jgi:hypothetical protein
MNVGKKTFICSLLLGGILLAVFSCSKNNYPSNPGNSTTSLWPLKAGNTWAYMDSVFSDSSLTNHYPDTLTINTTTTTNPGLDFYGFTDSNPYGWFPQSGSYLAVDSYNANIYELDGASTAPYIFFGTALQDGVLLGTGADYTNPNCPRQASQYGFATAVSVGGYSCLKNMQYNVDCNNITQELIVSYVSPGVGLVRIEDYLADSTKNNNLYLDYSQTLQSYSLAK